jgi:hypothetical protein
MVEAFWKRKRERKDKEKGDVPLLAVKQDVPFCRLDCSILSRRTARRTSWHFVPPVQEPVPHAAYMAVRVLIGLIMAGFESSSHGPETADPRLPQPRWPFWGVRKGGPQHDRASLSSPNEHFRTPPTAGSRTYLTAEGPRRKLVARERPCRPRQRASEPCAATSSRRACKLHRLLFGCGSPASGGVPSLAGTKDHECPVRSQDLREAWGGCGDGVGGGAGMGIQRTSTHLSLREERV